MILYSRVSAEKNLAAKTGHTSGQDTVSYANTFSGSGRPKGVAVVVSSAKLSSSRDLRTLRGLNQALM